MHSIVFLDIDGTIINEAGQLTPRLAAAITQLQSRDIKVFACTGRCPADTLAVQKGFTFDGYISLTGAVCVSRGQTLWQTPLSAEDLAAAVKTAQRCDYPIVFWDAKSRYANFTNETVKAVYGEDPACIDLSLLEPGRILQLQAFLPAGQEWRLMDSTSRLQYNRWHSAFIDVFAAGVSKKSGVQKLLEYYFIPKEQAIAFGDGETDIGMFSAVGTAVCMAESTAHVAMHADAVADSINGQGILPVLRRYFPFLTV